MRHTVDPDPLVSCRFFVEDDSSGVVAAFSQFSGIQMQVQTISNRYGDDSDGYLEYIPVVSSVAPITLSRGVIGDSDFMNWVIKCTAGLRKDDGFHDGRKDLVLVALNMRGERQMEWLLRNAFPVGYQLSPMGSDSNEILTESITIQVERVERTNLTGYTEEKRKWMPFEYSEPKWKNQQSPATDAFSGHR